VFHDSGDVPIVQGTERTNVTPVILIDLCPSWQLQGQPYSIDLIDSHEDVIRIDLPTTAGSKVG
jgi:hypothetical protein